MLEEFENKVINETLKSSVWLCFGFSGDSKKIERSSNVLGIWHLKAHMLFLIFFKLRKRFKMQMDGSRNGWDRPNADAECWVYVDGHLRGPQQVFSEPNRLFFAKYEELCETLDRNSVLLMGNWERGGKWR